MAKRNKTKIAESKYHCQDCAHSYDWHEIGAKASLSCVVAPITRMANIAVF